MEIPHARVLDCYPLPCECVIITCESVVHCFLSCRYRVTVTRSGGSFMRSVTFRTHGTRMLCVCSISLPELSTSFHEFFFLFSVLLQDLSGMKYCAEYSNSRTLSHSIVFS